MKEFPEDLKKWMAEQRWTFAKSYADTWPHCYLFRNERVDADRFFQLLTHIRDHGYDGKFYSKNIRYYTEDGYTYWTMLWPFIRGIPSDEALRRETIINRVKVEDSYEVRAKEGRLPARPSSPKVDTWKPAPKKPEPAPPPPIPENLELPF